MRWSGLGIFLNIPDSKRDEIRRLYSGDSKQCQALIQYWLGLDPSPTWRRVITALDDIGSEEQETADRIRSYAEPLTGISFVSSRAYDRLHSWSIVEPLQVLYEVHVETECQSWQQHHNECNKVKE